MLRGERPATLYHRFMVDAADRAVRSAAELGRRLGVEHHEVLVVLGSGLSPAGELLAGGEDAHPLHTLPFWPAPTASGHRALCWSAALGGRRVLVLGGRSHLYEGLDPSEVVHPIRTGIATGAHTVILTAAVGGIRPDLRPGSVLVVDDHLNLTGRSPLVGPACIDMVDAYAPWLRTLALGAPPPAAGVLAAATGVYAHMPGPQFETPAEINALRTLGADVVGMSMALETIAARHAGAEVLGLAVVTNAAASAATPTAIAEVHTVGAAAAASVAGIVRHVVGSLP
jgi:purine-nucleoside phosphorylase